MMKLRPEEKQEIIDIVNGKQVGTYLYRDNDKYVIDIMRDAVKKDIYSITVLKHDKSNEYDIISYNTVEAKSPKELIDFLQSFDYKNYRGYASGYAEYLFYNL